MSTSNFKPNNYLEKFRKRIPGKKDLPEDIDSQIVASGDLKHLTGIDAIVAGIVRILLTSQGTYVFDPVFGLGLHKYIFEPKDDITREKVQSEVQQALRRYEDRAKITTNVRHLKNVKGFAVDITISYKGEDKRLTINVDESLLRTIEER